MILCGVFFSYVGFYCTCIGSFSGNTCDTPIPLCLTDSQPCFNGGKCNPTTNKCECSANFVGDKCETYKLPPRAHVKELLQNNPYQNNSNDAKN